MGGQGSGRKLEVKWAPAKGTHPWERQPGEGDKPWVGFVTYRDMEMGRTLAGATRVLGKKPGYAHVMEAWSIKHFWRFRVEAWDAHKDEVSREALLDARRDAARGMVERHLSLSTQLQRLVTVELMRWLRKTGADKPHPDIDQAPSLHPSQIQGLLDYAVKLERLNRNEPEAIFENRTKPSTAELEDRIAHLLKVRDDQ